MESQICCRLVPAILGCGGGLNERKMVPDSSVVPEMAETPVLTQKPDNLVPPYMPLMIFELLPLC